MSIKAITWFEIEAACPEIMFYLLQLGSVRSLVINPWYLYEQAKHDLIPLIPDRPGAYGLVMQEVIRRLKL